MIILVNFLYCFHDIPHLSLLLLISLNATVHQYVACWKPVKRPGVTPGHLGKSIVLPQT